MMTKKKPVSKAGRYAAYDRFLEAIPPRSMTKRAKYLHGIGVFRGIRGDTAWVKIRLPHGGLYKGKYYKAGDSVEIKVGNLDSYDWGELEDVRKEYQSKADKGEALEQVEVPLFSQYVSDWLEIKKNQHRGYKITKGIVDNHLTETFGHKPLSAITTGDINRWQGKQLAIHSASTVKRQKVVLQSILSSAERDDHITVNPCAKSDSIKVPDKEPRYLTGLELVTLLANAEQVASWLPDYILFAIHTGMRRGEIAALKWKQVIESPEGVFLRFPTGKTQKIRTIHCGETVRDILKRLKANKKDSDDRVFQMSLTTVIRKWREAREAAGLKDVRIQDLRATSATYAALSGVDLRTLAGRLGHSDLTMLERHYAALTGSGAVEASGKIEVGINMAMEQAQEKTP